MKHLIFQLDQANTAQESKQGLKINKIVSSISPLNFIRLLKDVDTKVNPRIAAVNKITKSISETLDSNPTLFWFKSKGILLATKNCETLSNNRIKITLDDTDYEGIMDGGHNMFAIAAFIVQKLYAVTFKKWSECKEFWKLNFDDIIVKFEKRSAEFNFSIPIEIIYPNGKNGSEDQFYNYISEICSARNNNVQLSETAKGNQVGNYEFLKEYLKKYNIIWKTGDIGNIEASEVIGLATLPLMFLKVKGKLPNGISNLSRISIYSQKGRCIDFYNEIISHSDVSSESKGKNVLNHKGVESALALCEDILKFFDLIYYHFPVLYNNNSGKFGGISAVNRNKKNKIKSHFGTLKDVSEYNYPPAFIYPLVYGLVNLMEYDEKTKTVRWRINPLTIDLKKLDFKQYINMFKVVYNDPQKIGKGDVFYGEADTIFSKL
jgi:hypothetical protein